MKRTISFLLMTFTLTISAFTGFAKNDNTEFRYRGFSGGMFMHSGYSWCNPYTTSSHIDGSIQSILLKGAPIGIGGAAKVHFGTLTDLLRIGTEGGSTTIPYNPRPSYFHIGWGGLTFDYMRQTNKKIHPFAGILVGGGGIKNHIFIKGSANDMKSEENILFRKYIIMHIAPYIGAEIEISRQFRISLKADYLIHTTDNHADLPQMLRFYVGFMFCH